MTVLAGASARDCRIAMRMRRVGAVVCVVALAAGVPAAAAAPPALPIAAAATTVPVPSTVADPGLTGTTIVEQIGDPAANRRVNRIIAALLGLAALVVLLTLWFWRATSPLHPALEAVDLMSTRRYWRATDEKRSAMLGKLAKRRSPADDRVVDLDRSVASDLTTTPP
jgi:hypothetical protein